MFIYFTLEVLSEIADCSKTIENSFVLYLPPALLFSLLFRRLVCNLLILRFDLTLAFFPYCSQLQISNNDDATFLMDVVNDVMSYFKQRIGVESPISKKKYDSQRQLNISTA